MVKKTSALVGWSIGLAVGLFVFSTAGVWVLFAVSYGVMHSDGSAGMMIYLFGSWIAVPAACFWLAYSIKRALTRDR